MLNATMSVITPERLVVSHEDIKRDDGADPEEGTASTAPAPSR